MKKVDGKGRNTLAHFWENFKKVKIPRTQKRNFFLTFSDKYTENNVFWSHDLIFYFFQLSKMRQIIWTHSSHFVFYEILCNSNFLGRTSPRCCSRDSPDDWIKKNKTKKKKLDDYNRKIHWKILMTKIFNFFNLKRKKYRSFPKLKFWKLKKK